jgi:PKD repeat protein
MRNLLLSVFLTVLFSAHLLHAQSGCPGCITELPAGLAADTVYLPPLPSGQQGVYYDHDISFRLPKTTTPVAAIDSTTPPGLTITSLEILSVQGLPPGLSWQASQTFFDVATQTDGCIKICGTPLSNDTFVIDVVLKATVFIIVQETSFSETLYIAPPGSTTEGFSMTNNEGCGSTTVTFTNNIPSGGAPGFEYAWQFGDSSAVYEGEQPPPYTYNTPGTYVVSYGATVDTSGFTLTKIRVLESDCEDQLGLGTPDLFVRIKDPNGAQIIETPVINNATLPTDIILNLLVGEGNYTLELWDEDSGLKGGDDLCGSVPFNQLSNDTLTSGGFSAVFEIIHPVTYVTSTDTVRVYEQPAPPVITAPAGLTRCANSPAPIILEASVDSLIQWYYQGAPILGATDVILNPTESGFYVVTYTSPDGCTAGSEPVQVTFVAPPAVPFFVNNNNRLRLLDTTSLPDNYQLYWFRSGFPVPVGTGLTHCSLFSGTYILVVEDLDTDCANSYSLAIIHDPLYDCTVDTDKPYYAENWLIAPNPTSTYLDVLLPDSPTDGMRIEVMDMTGRICTSVPCTAATTRIDVARWAVGMYAVRIMMPDGRSAIRRFVKH